MSIAIQGENSIQIKNTVSTFSTSHLPLPSITNRRLQVVYVDTTFASLIYQQKVTLCKLSHIEIKSGR